VEPPDHLTVPVRRSWIAGLLPAGLVLGLVSAALQLAKDRGFNPPSLQLDRLLNVDEDLSFMNWLTSATFLLAAVAAAAVAGAQPARRLRWLALAGALAFVSLDEAVQVHDPLTTNAEEGLRAGGPAALAIILVAVAVAAAVVMFVLRLDPPVRWRVAGALGLVVVAAIGIDAVGPDLVDDPEARLRPGYVARSTLEEILELGASLLVLDAMVVAAVKR
jgi:hypothetical protein